MTECASLKLVQIESTFVWRDVSTLGMAWMGVKLKLRLTVYNCQLPLGRSPGVSPQIVPYKALKKYLLYL